MNVTIRSHHGRVYVREDDELVAIMERSPFTGEWCIDAVQRRQPRTYEIAASFAHGVTKTQFADDAESAMEIAESYWLRPDCEYAVVRIAGSGEIYAEYEK